MKTVLCPTIRVKGSSVRRSRQLISAVPRNRRTFLAEREQIGQVVPQLGQKLFGPRAITQSGQGHIERIAVDPNGFGKLFAAPFFVESELGSKDLAFDSEIFDHDVVSPNIKWFSYSDE
jgi:hypothetical protein